MKTKKINQVKEFIDEFNKSLLEVRPTDVDTGIQAQLRDEVVYVFYNDIQVGYVYDFEYLNLDELRTRIMEIGVAARTMYNHCVFDMDLGEIELRRATNSAGHFRSCSFKDDPNTDAQWEIIEKYKKENGENNKIHFRQHIPNFCDFCDREEYDVETLEEVFEREKRYLNDAKYNLVWACTDSRTLLVSATNEEWWWVVGFVDGIDLTKHLPKSSTCYKGEKQ